MNSSIVMLDHAGILLHHTPTKWPSSLHSIVPLKINFAANSDNVESICVIRQLLRLSIDFRALTK